MRRRRRDGDVRAALAPSEASAHGLGGSTSPGIPGWLFAWGAALALVLSLVAFWRRPRLEHAGERRLGRVPRPLDPIEPASTLGLVLCVLAMAGAYRAGITGMRRGRDDERTSVLAARFVHSLLPIVLAYVIAHYATLLLFQGQAVASWRCG